MHPQVHYYCPTPSDRASLTLGFRTGTPGSSTHRVLNQSPALDQWPIDPHTNLRQRGVHLPLGALACLTQGLRRFSCLSHTAQASFILALALCRDFWLGQLGRSLFFLFKAPWDSFLAAPLLSSRILGSGFQVGVLGCSRDSASRWEGSWSRLAGLTTWKGDNSLLPSKTFTRACRGVPPGLG